MTILEALIRLRDDLKRWVTVNLNHKANIENGQYVITPDSFDEATYTYHVTVPGITELKRGLSFIFVPDVYHYALRPKINVNGLGAHDFSRTDVMQGTEYSGGVLVEWPNVYRLSYSDNGIGSWVIENMPVIEPENISDLTADSLTATVKELNYMDGVTSNVQTQLDGKADSNHDHIDATTSASGFMSASDKTQLNNGGVPIANATSTDGANYYSTIDGFEILASPAGTKITVIPNMDNTVTTPKLFLNDSSIGLSVFIADASYSGGIMGALGLNNDNYRWISKDKPLTLEYDGLSSFRAINVSLTRSSDLVGVTPISKGGTAATTAADALANLGLTATANEINILDGVTATTDELNYCSGVTSGIQSQLDLKAARSHIHSASQITSGILGITRGGTGSANAADALTNLGAQEKHITMTCTLQAGTWSGVDYSELNVAVSGVTTSNTVVISPDPDSHNAYCEAGVYCSEQKDGYLVFKQMTPPTEDLLVNILILN